MDRIMPFMVGAVMGAATAALFAPRTGTETRRRIKEGIEDAREKLREGYETLRDTGEKLAEAGKGRLSLLGGKVREPVEENKENMEAKVPAEDYLAMCVG